MRYLFLLALIVANLVYAVDFNYILKDTNNDNKKDEIIINDDIAERIIDIGSGSIKRFYLKNKKFKENLIPEKTQGVVFGKLFLKDKFITFSLKEINKFNDKIIILLESNSGIKRKYVFYENRFDFEGEIININKKENVYLEFGPYISKAYNMTQNLCFYDEKLVKYNFKKVVSVNIPDTIKFISFLESYYNFTLRFNEKPYEVKVKAINDKDKKIKGIRLLVVLPSVTNYRFSLYIGPNNRDTLKNIEAEGLINYGFFSNIALLLLSALKLFYTFTNNWGISIIILTIVIKLLLHPLTIKQTKSMAEMQKIQPIINNLRERFKNDPQRLNAEIMKVYKEHNVNPFGGCLPVLIQLPILFALFTVLRVSIELKGESFLWLKDLATPDSTMILPILVAVTMYFQQKTMPNATDPQQQSMMMFMPILMFIFARALASGVVLYWFISTLLGIIEQRRLTKFRAPVQKGNQKK